MMTVIILIALLSSFIILYLSKVGLREKVQVYAPRLISQLFSCDLCLSFWVCFGLSVLYFIFVDRNYLVLSYALFATPIARITL